MTGGAPRLRLACNAACRLWTPAMLTESSRSHPRRGSPSSSRGIFTPSRRSTTTSTSMLYVYTVFGSPSSNLAGLAALRIAAMPAEHFDAAVATAKAGIGSAARFQYLDFCAISVLKPAAKPDGHRGRPLLGFRTTADSAEFASLTSA